MTIVKFVTWQWCLNVNLCRNIDSVWYLVSNATNNEGGRKCCCHHLFSWLIYVNCGTKLPTQHTWDAMHSEKNICKNLLRTLFGKTIGVKSWDDMRTWGIWNHLHLQRNADGCTHFKPDTLYVKTRELRQ